MEAQRSIKIRRGSRDLLRFDYTLLVYWLCAATSLCDCVRDIEGSQLVQLRNGTQLGLHVRLIGFMSQYIYVWLSKS